MTTSSVTCEIKLNKFPDKIYYNGDQIKGNITLILSKYKWIFGVYVKIIENSHCDYNTQHFHKNEEIMSMGEKYLVGCSGSTTELLMRPGTYLYEFQFDLPVEIPSSIRTVNGYVQYFVLVCVHYSTLPRQEFMNYFIVRKKFDLNILPELRNSYTREKSITFYDSCWFVFCSQTNPLTISVHIPVTGYVAGEQIITILKINNQSIDIQLFLIKIVKIIDFYATNTGLSKLRSEIVVAEKRVEGISAGQYKEFNNYVTVPADCPSTDLTSSKICKIQYVLRIVGILNACCVKLPKFEVPITIGTTPLLVSTEQQTELSAVIVNQPLPFGPLLQLNQEAEYTSDGNSLNGQSLPVEQQAQLSKSSIIVRQQMPSASIRPGNVEDEFMSDLPTYEEAMRLPSNCRSSH